MFQVSELYGGRVKKDKGEVSGGGGGGRGKGEVGGGDIRGER